jgi:maltooligosyltrehalose trehalohydrolase
MTRDERGYHRAVLADLEAGAKYFFRFENLQERPDPASRFQPHGVHGPSELVDLQKFEWTDHDWTGIALQDSVFYELHVGTFTEAGTFRAIAGRLPELARLGVTTIELMPVAQFSGARNWGYDGVYPFAVQSSYGTPYELQSLVNEAHSRGIAVALDVVYNHLGPEGNYLPEYGPYFTDHYRTPWGAALNFDGPGSDEVRRFFIENALYWLEHFHIDALRLDAIHGIVDASAVPFLAELSDAVRALASRLGREIPLIAESDLNDARVLRATSAGGLGMVSQWSDDFHHSVHTLLTRERSGYYADFGGLQPLAETLRHGWYYDGRYSQHRQRRHGNSAPDFEGSNFTVCTQNHDQVGNRALGDRLSRLVSFENLKLAAGIHLLSPFVPLLFMGEEYGETAPFQYFTSHEDAGLADAVRKGRAAEFRRFEWQGEIPDPQAESTFHASRLNPRLAEEEPHRTLMKFYQVLLQFRRRHTLGRMGQPAVTEFASSQVLMVQQQSKKGPLAMLFNFGEHTADLSVSLTAGSWERVIDSADLQWLGPESKAPSFVRSDGNLRLNLPARSFVVFEWASGSAE